MSELSKFLEKSERTVHVWLSKLGIKEKPDQESPQLIEARKRVYDKKKKRFIVTWAQNDTPVHEAFISNIEAYAAKIDASIHVIAGRPEPSDHQCVGQVF